MNRRRIGLTIRAQRISGLGNAWWRNSWWVGGTVVEKGGLVDRLVDKGKAGRVKKPG